MTPLELTAALCGLNPNNLSALEVSRLELLRSHARGIIAAAIHRDEDYLAGPEVNQDVIEYCTTWIVTRSFRRIRDAAIGLKSETFKAVAVTYMDERDLSPFLLEVLRPYMPSYVG